MAVGGQQVPTRGPRLIAGVDVGDDSLKVSVGMKATGMNKGRE